MSVVEEPMLAMRSFAFDRLSASAAVLDASGVIVDTNEAWRLFAQLNDGTRGATGLGTNYLDVCDRAAAGMEGAAAVAAGLRQILSGEREHFDLEYPCPSPTEDRWFMLQASRAPVANGIGVVLFHVNMTAHKVLEDRLTGEAEHDALTGLPNRRSATRFIEHHLADARTSHALVWALFFDLDGFKAANDTYGHHAGDELLVQVALRARRAMRDEDLLCRFGGDEFVVVCPGLTEDDAFALALAARLREVMSQPFQVGSEEISIGVSIGCASSTVDSTVDSLLGAADAQMYVDKGRSTRRRSRGVAR